MRYLRDECQNVIKKNAVKLAENICVGIFVRLSGASRTDKIIHKGSKSDIWAIYKNIIKESSRLM